MTSAPVRSALVTGASGFMGRVLCARLQRGGALVRALGRRRAEGPWDEFVTYDLPGDGSPSAAVAEVDTVFHLAGKAHVEPRGIDDPEQRAVTVDGTRRLLDAAVTAGVTRFIFMSSVKANGHGDRPTGNEWDRQAGSAYGRAKREAEQLVVAAGARSGMHTTVLRPSLVYGPGWKGHLERMFRAVDAGWFPPPPPIANRRSMVHVSDVATAALLAAERPGANGRTYCLSDGESYSTRRVYEAMCRVLGRRVPRWHVPVVLLRAAARAGDLAAGSGRWSVPFDSDTLERLLGSAWYVADAAREELQWAPGRTFEESLPEIAESQPIGAHPARTGTSGRERDHGG